MELLAQAAGNILQGCKEQWKNAIFQKLRVEFPAYDSVEEPLRTKLFLDVFFHTDIAICGATPLPDLANMSTMEGSFIVQVEEARDISKPINERYRDTYNNNRTLSLCLYDGHRQFVAVEDRSIALDTHVKHGAKVLLRGPIKVVRGMLLLREDNIALLGGHVEEKRADQLAMVEFFNREPTGHRGPPFTLQEFYNTAFAAVLSSKQGAAATTGRPGSQQAQQQVHMDAHARPRAPPSPAPGASGGAGGVNQRALPQPPSQPINQPVQQRQQQQQQQQQGHQQQRHRQQQQQEVVPSINFPQLNNEFPSSGQPTPQFGQGLQPHADAVEDTAVVDLDETQAPRGGHVVHIIDSPRDDHALQDNNAIQIHPRAAESPQNGHLFMPRVAGAPAGPTAATAVPHRGLPEQGEEEDEEWEDDSDGDDGAGAARIDTEDVPMIIDETEAGPLENAIAAACAPTHSPGRPFMQQQQQQLQQPQGPEDPIIDPDQHLDMRNHTHQTPVAISYQGSDARKSTSGKKRQRTSPQNGVPGSGGAGNGNGNGNGTMPNRSGGTMSRTPGRADAGGPSGVVSRGTGMPFPPSSNPRRSPPEHGGPTTDASPGRAQKNLTPAFEGTAAGHGNNIVQVEDIDDLLQPPPNLAAIRGGVALPAAMPAGPSMTMQTHLAAPAAPPRPQGVHPVPTLAPFSAVPPLPTTANNNNSAAQVQLQLPRPSNSEDSLGGDFDALPSSDELNAATDALSADQNYPYTHLYTLSYMMNDPNTRFPLSVFVNGTVQTLIPLTSVLLYKNSENKVKTAGLTMRIEDGSGLMEVVMNDALLIDLLYGHCRTDNSAPADSAEGIYKIWQNSAEFPQGRQNVKNAFRKIQNQLAVYMGLMELRVAARGAIPVLVDLQTDILSASQMEALRQRAQMGL